MRHSIAVTRLIAECVLAPAAITATPAQDVSRVSIAAASNADGRPEVFAIGADGNAYHPWRQSRGPSDWSEWTLASAARFSKLCVRRLSDARLYPFGLDEGQLVVRAHEAPNGSWLNESFRRGSQLRDLPVAQSADGHFSLTAVGGNGGRWTSRSVVNQ